MGSVMEFRKKMGLALIKTATNPAAPNRQLRGSYPTLEKEFEGDQSGLGYLREMTMTEPRKIGEQRLNVSEDGVWSLTTSGVTEYNPYLEQARKHLGISKS